MDRTAAALIIGNELLSGKVQEQNLIVLARTLRDLGIELSRVVMVADDIDIIAREVAVLASAHDHVFTSGGIGPTHDDVTIEAVARALGVPVVAHPRLETMLRDYYRDRCNDCHLRMALLPEGAELITSEEVRWPSIVARNVWILPGIPEVFKMKMPLLRMRLSGGTPFQSRAVYTKLDEGDLKPLLDRVVAGHPAVAVGSYPKWQDPAYKTKLTFDGRDEQAVAAALREFLSLLPEGEPQRVE